MTWLLTLLTFVVMMLVTPHMTNALILEAEDAHFSDGFKVATNHPGFTGSGFVDAVQEGFTEWYCTGQKSEKRIQLIYMSFWPHEDIP